jgi:hypothetical protein
VVADLFYLLDLIGKSPILHIRDSATGCSETSSLPSRGKDVLLSTVNMCWFHRHGNPQSFSADLEFYNLALNLELMGIRFVRAPARSPFDDKNCRDPPKSFAAHPVSYHWNST